MALHLPHDIEVYSLFSHLMPAVIAGKWGAAVRQSRKGFRLRLSTPQGPTDCLAELKVIGTRVTFHLRG